MPFWIWIKNYQWRCIKVLEDEKKKNDPNSEIPERPDYEKELEAIIKSNLSDDEIREKLSDYHENDIADVLEDLTEE